MVNHLGKFLGIQGYLPFFLKETFSWKFTAAAFWGLALFPGNLTVFQVPVPGEFGLNKV